MSQPVSDEIKKQMGTLNVTRAKDKKLSFTPLSGIPTPIQNLNAAARNYFEFICGILLSQGMLTAADIPYITRISRYCALHDEMEEKIVENGAVYESESGYSQISGYFSVSEKCHKHITEFESKYGFDPVSRQRIIAPKVSDKDDYLDD